MSFPNQFAAEKKGRNRSLIRADIPGDDVAFLQKIARNSS